ncbi:MAG: transposase [Actinomycetota bacterium]
MAEAEDQLPPVALDGPWKESLERFFEPFMGLFFPQAHAEIDWSRGYESLDSELQQIARDAELGQRLADKLIRVWRFEGEEAWVLVHVEVQGQPDPGFPERMYVYNYRCYDRFRKSVMSVAVLGDTQRSWRPDRFGYDLWGSRAGLQFVSVKLLDWEARWEELERIENPFALIVMAHLRAVTTRGSAGTRYEWKLRLARALYRSGLKREDVLELFRFLDWILALPPELERGFSETVQIELEEHGMPYVTSWERFAKEEGLKEGQCTGLRRAVESSLLFRFERVPPDISQTLAGIADADLLDRLHLAALEAETLDAFRTVLARYETN